MTSIIPLTVHISSQFMRDNVVFLTVTTSVITLKYYIYIYYIYYIHVYTSNVLDITSKFHTDIMFVTVDLQTILLIPVVATVQLTHVTGVARTNCL